MSAAASPWLEMAVWVPDEGYCQPDPDLAELDRQDVCMSALVGAVALASVLAASLLTVLAT
ncbi:MAG: hypothetical protein IV094_26170 [Vitreoscilla sp.]|nr:hypothetical protein [Vitreoscilla sp.]